MNKDTKITEQNEIYLVKDITDGGYVDRMTLHSYQYWVSQWTMNLGLSSITLNGENIIEKLRDKNDYDYHRIKKAVGRHKKALREHLALDVKKVIPITKYFIREKNPMYSLSSISQREFVEKQATFEAAGSYKEVYKKRSIYYTEVTKEKECLVQEYNEKLKQFIAYRDEIFEKIFE